MKFFKRFWEKTKQTAAYVKGVTIGGIIMLVFTIYIAAALLPGAINQWIAGGNESWGVGAYAIWGLGTLIIIFAVVYGFLKMSGILKG